MKILIVDDEPLASDRLCRIVEEIAQKTGEQYEAVTASNGIEAIHSANTYDADIILMDIRMPGMDGLEAARHLSALDNPPAIVFTTAYDEYALQAFESQAIDYLLKPIRKENLEKALHNCCKLNKLQLEVLELNNQQVLARTHITAQIRGNILLIPMEDIICFQADHKYTTVKYIKDTAQTENSSPENRLKTTLAETVIEESLKSLEQEFKQYFLRVHRNALIRKDKIHSLIKQENIYVIKLKQLNKGIEVSRRHLSEVRKWMNK